MIYAILFLTIILAGQSGPKRPASVCDPDPALAALFTPKRPGAGHYDVCTTPDRIEAVLAEESSQGLQFGPVEPLDPLDAFGTAGPYERSALSRLFGGRRAGVAHGWSKHDRSLTSVTLVSPYPNRTLTALVPGTLVVRYVLESGGL